MFRPTTAAASRVAAPLKTSTRQYTQASLRPARRQVLSARTRTFATEANTPPPPSSEGGNHTGTIIILAALAGIAGGGYYLLKPVADVASVTHSAIKTAQDGTSGLADQAQGIAKSMLPPSAFAVYSALASQPGGINGFLSSLKDKDLQGVLDEVKKHGGEDIKRITEKVEKRVKEAKGDVSKVDWKALAQELKEELPKDKQHMVDMFIGKIPDKADLDQLIKKAKEAGGDQLKAAEQAASKILAQVEKAKKEGKGQANAFLSGLKQSTPDDVDELVKQLKETAKKAGLPADTIESWLKSKAEDKNIDPEALGKQVEDKVKTAAKFLPNDPQDLVKQVEQISPSVAKLLQQVLEEAEVIKNKK